MAIGNTSLMLLSINKQTNVINELQCAQNIRNIVRYEYGKVKKEVSKQIHLAIYFRRIVHVLLHNEHFDRAKTSTEIVKSLSIALWIILVNSVAY